MPKHTIFNRRVAKDPAPAVHPIWRGIGCILIIVIPVLSFIIATILINNRATIPWFDIPQDLIVSVLKDPLIFVKIFYTAVISLLIFFLMALVTFTMDRIINPKKKGPYDVD
jgi:hypothetical protein